jgi:hypothetical protein
MLLGRTVTESSLFGCHAQISNECLCQAVRMNRHHAQPLHLAVNAAPVNSSMTT